MKKLIIFIAVIVFSKTFFVNKGWNLLGTSDDVNVTNFDVDIVWKYKNSVWSYFSKKYNLNYKKFKTLKKGEGFWILSNKNIIFSNKKVLILPLYFYDMDKWNKIININNDEIVIINPLNGPGEAKDNNYKNLINSLVKNKKVPIGYIFTNYGKKDINDIKNQINRWINLYPKIKGFFFDEVKNGNFNYYKEIYDFIKNKGNFLVVLNVGTKPDKNYFNIADIVVVYEGKDKEYTKFCNDFPQKSALVMFNINKEDMKNLINAKCRYIFINDSKINSYKKLPSYFEDEIKFLK